AELDPHLHRVGVAGRHHRRRRRRRPDARRGRARGGGGGGGTGGRGGPGGGLHGGGGGAGPGGGDRRERRARGVRGGGAAGVVAAGGLALPWRAAAATGPPEGPLSVRAMLPGCTAAAKAAVTTADADTPVRPGPGVRVTTAGGVPAGVALKTTSTQ